MTARDGWRRATLAEVAKWGSGGTPTAGNGQFYGGDIPWAVIGDLNDGVVSSTARTITRAGLDASSAKWVPEGAVLVAMYGSIGKLGIAGSPMTTNQAIAFAIPRDDLDPKFLFYYLMSQRRELDAMGKGATQRNISQSILKPWPITLPWGICEQRWIVEILEDHLSHLDAADREIGRAATRLDALLLTALRSHVSEIYDLGTPFERIGDLADTSLGKMLDAKKTTGEPTPYLANINVRWGRFDLDRLKSVPLTADERARLTMRPGDVIVCEGGEPGRCAVWDRENSGIAYQKALHRVRVHDPARIDPTYLAMVLREAIQSGRADRLFTGTTIKHLPQEKLRMIEIPLPERSVQQAMLGEVGAISEATERLNAMLQSTAARGNALRRAVLAAAFEGKLTGRRTDAEAIEELAVV